MSLHWTVLDSLHRCNSCIVWSLCGTSNSGSRGCLWHFCQNLGSFPSTWWPSPTLIGEDVTSRTATGCAIAGYSWMISTFLKGNRSSCGRMSRGKYGERREVKKEGGRKEEKKKERQTKWIISSSWHFIVNFLVLLKFSFGLKNCNYIISKLLLSIHLITSMSPN